MTLTSNVGRYRTIKCRNCRRLRAIESPKVICYRCEDHRWQRQHGGCIAELSHGPGHQSTTYCDVKPGEHRKENGRLVHSAEYSGGRMEWHGRHGCTGYFDESSSSPGSGERWEGAGGGLFSSKARAAATLQRSKP